MKSLMLMIKGFFIGIALIIPGLSGGTLAIYLGIYEKLLHAIGNVFNEFKDSITFLVPLFIGIGISVVSLAKLLGYLIDINSLIVLLFFMGLVLGGTKDIYQKANNDQKPLNLSSTLAFFVSLLLVLLLIVFGKLQSNTGIDYIDINIMSIIVIFLLGMSASITMIVPGVSGSALLIVLGYYTAIVTNVAGQVLDVAQLSYNIQVIIPFALGAAVGIIIFSRVIEWALKNYAKQTYYAILGFIIGSVFAIFFEIKDPTTAATHEMQTPIYQYLWSFISDNILSFFIGIVLFAVGFMISKKLSQLELEG